MEAAQRSGRYPGRLKRRSAKRWRAPNGFRDNWTLPTLGLRDVNIWMEDFDGENLMQTQCWESTNTKLVESEPAVPLPTMEVLPMLSNSTISSAMYTGIDYHK